MTASTIIIDYLGQGLHSARPSSPNIPSGGTAVYAETDTGNTYIWLSGTWALIAGSLATGINQLTADVLAGPGGGSQAATIAAGAVTNGKLAAMPAGTIKANITGSAGAPQDADASDVAEMLAPYLPGSIFFLPLSKLADYTITPAESSTFFNNLVATSDIALTLPAAAAGLWYGVAVIAPHYVRVNAAGSNTIRLGSSSTAAGGFVRSNSPVSVIVLQAHDTSGWVASSIVGAWGVDGAPPATGGGGGGSGGAIVSDTAPSSPTYGQLWVDSTNFSTFVYYDDPTADVWVQIASVTAPSAPKYSVAFSFVGGVLAASQLLGIHCFSKAVTFAANFGAYGGHSPEAGGTANATASTVIAVEKSTAASPNTWTGVGTITISAGGITPTFATSSGAEISFSAGDRMRLLGPSSADPTFANLYTTLIARES